MHDLNSAANTDDSSGIDRAANNSDLEVNMIIKELENEFLLQVCGVAVHVLALAEWCGVLLCIRLQRSCVSQSVWQTAKHGSAWCGWLQVHIASQGWCFGGVDHD